MWVAQDALMLCVCFLSIAIARSLNWKNAQIVELWWCNTQNLTFFFSNAHHTTHVTFASTTNATSTYLNVHYTSLVVVESSSGSLSLRLTFPTTKMGSNIEDIIPITKHWYQTLDRQIHLEIRGWTKCSKEERLKQEHRGMVKFTSQQI